MQMHFDPEDTALIAVVALASAAMAGLATFGAFNVSLSDTFSAGGHSVSLAYAATVAAFGVTLWTNDHDVTDLSGMREKARGQLNDTYYYLLLGSIAVMVAWPFFPEVANFVQSQDLWGVLFIAGSVGAQVAIGYLR